MFDKFIVKEGQKSIIITLVVMIVFAILEYEVFTFLTFAVMVFSIYLYRNKNIDIKTLKENEVYAPISGRVTTIDVKDFKKSIHIDVGLLDSHILRALESSKVQIEYKRGLNLSLNTLKAKNLNETAIIKSENLTMQLISSTYNSKIDLIQKESFEKGEKIGTFLNGKVIITFDSKIEVKVTIGQELQSGETIIAQIVS